jgi:hypothetical protein
LVLKVSTKINRNKKILKLKRRVEKGTNPNSPNLRKQQKKLLPAFALASLLIFKTRK